NKMLVVYMGASILIGSFIGSFSANLLDEHAVNVVYTVLATIAAMMMFVPKKNNSGAVKYNKWLASVLAFIVGGVSGIIGAGGAFLLV
ncbi:TSUP family transporter, partial [Acinetobacter baumannii]